jgi:catalase
MHLSISCVVAAVATLLVLPSVAARAQTAPSDETVVDTFEKISGVHKGLRRNHAKGVCAAGEFKADAAASALSSSLLFSGQTIPVVARFSVAGPDPAASDASTSPRGMALRFQLPDGNLHQMALLNAPIFPAANVQTFYESLLINIPDPATGKPDPEKPKAFVAAHPEALPFLQWLGSHNPPPSYAEAAYYSLHAFKLTAADKTTHWARWRMEPRDGEKLMSADELAASPTNFLDERLAARAKQGPIVWDMIVTLGEAGDSIDNPSLAWPKDRREVKVGALSIAKAGGGACDDVNFDPTVVSAGFEISPDPILAFRSLAYAQSAGRRLGEKPN